MTLIKLTGELDQELTSLGLQPGDIVDAERDEISKVGVMHFKKIVNHYPYMCSVWPENYELVKEIAE